MEIEFDPDKDALNQTAHGLSIADAADMDFSKATIDHDRRYDYGEDRFQALGLIGGRVHMLVFTMRGNTLRAISLRKANPKEVRYHAERP